MLGAVRVAADARLAEFYLEDAEVAQLDRLPMREAFREMVERALDDVEDILLDHSRFVADANDEIALR